MNETKIRKMGRVPCCDKVGIKRGPWTPEEDTVLVAYIQKHGPQNWRSVPIQAGLMRCSKSCRLRWTNYLRPGIKRGNFTLHEEKMIINLQSLLGNKWAAIASYLPQRTDNDIKNYWNTHLKKKIKKQLMLSTSMQNYSTSSKMNYPNLPRFATFNSANYALSTENISRLLDGWMKSSSTTMEATTATTANTANQGNVDHINTNYSSISSKSSESNNEQGSSEDLESLLSFENPHSGVSDGQVPHLSPFEKWLATEQLVDGLMEISDSIF